MKTVKQLRDRIINCVDQKSVNYINNRDVINYYERSYRKNVIDTIDTVCGATTKLFFGVL